LDSQPATSRLNRWAPALVFCAAVAIYLPNLLNRWAWDDDYLVVNNPAVHTLGQAGHWFADPWSAGTTSAQGRRQNALYWRPLTQASYALDWVLSGGQPWLFHLTNDLLHGLASALVTLLVLLWGRKRGIGGRPLSAAAIGAGLLFAVHPVHSEAVNLITYRTSLLAAVGVLGGLYSHCVGTGWRSTLLAALCFALGLMSKENAIVLPGLVLLCDMALGRIGAERWRLLQRYLPLLVVAIGYLVLHRSLTGPAALDFFVGASSYEVFLTMMKVIGLDLRLIILPWPLTPFYDWSIFPVATSMIDLEVIAGALALLLLLALVALALARGWALLALTIGFFLIALVPYLHLVPFFDVAGERFLYLPSAGPCAGAGLGLGLALSRRYRPQFVAALGGLVILIFGALTIIRTPHFASTRALLLETTRRYPESFAAHYYLGRTWLEQGDPHRAAASLKRAHAIMPEIEPCTLALADALVRCGRRAEAVVVLRRALTRPGGATQLLRRRLRQLNGR
jgi:protein O-mannosyl-transferase